MDIKKLIVLANDNSITLAHYAKDWKSYTALGDPVIDAIYYRKTWRGIMIYLGISALCLISSWIWPDTSLFVLCSVACLVLLSLFSITLTWNNGKSSCAFCRAISLMEKTSNWGFGDGDWQPGFKETMMAHARLTFRERAKDVMQMQRFSWRSKEASSMREALVKDISLVGGLLPIELEIGRYFE